MIAFSPHIRHALNFALKYHEGQKRKGRNAPYIMHPMQVALILARYGRPDEELIAALLHDVVEDCGNTNAEADGLREQIRDKFGDDVARIVEGVTETKRDENDVELPREAKRKLYLEKLGTAPIGSLWVCAADKIQNGGEVLVDLLHASDRDAVWNAFSGGKPAVVSWYRSVHGRLGELRFDAGIMEELNHTATMLECAAVSHDEQLPRSRAIGALADH